MEETDRMKDSDIIQAAYADELTRLFSVYFSALVSATGRPAAETQAAGEFNNGLALARRARDQAVEFVQSGTSP
jgi:hypothetical protein